jgi:16S rRNA (guanine527-N7)-methyltransferase
MLDDIDYKNLLIRSANEIGIEINNEQAKKFLLYIELLLEFNKKVNLTAIVLKEEIIVKHFIDSISILSVEYFKFALRKNNFNMIDIGSGAGFPGIPIKILYPEINLTIVDSLLKRINFINILKKELNIKNISCVHDRAENIAKNNLYREHYDLCVARAVANLSILSELCLPFVKINNFFVAYKGNNISQEVQNAKSIINNLGGKIFKIKNINLRLKENNLLHSLVFIKKISKTNTIFPREHNKIYVKYN